MFADVFSCDESDCSISLKATKSGVRYELLGMTIIKACFMHCPTIFQSLEHKVAGPLKRRMSAAEVKEVASQEDSALSYVLSNFVKVCKNSLAFMYTIRATTVQSLSSDFKWQKTTTITFVL